MIANKMLFLFFLISSTFAENLDRIACDGIVFNGVYYDKELLFNNSGRPYNLVYHNNLDVLFFSHTIQNGSHVDFGIAACHVATRKCKDVAGVLGGYAIAYDVKNDDVYFGGHDGIYKYNFLTKDAEFFAERGKSIWGLFVKDHLYYISYPTQKLYVYQVDRFVSVVEAEKIEIDDFFISKHNVIYFSNKTALYKIDPKTEAVTKLLKDTVRQIAEDAFGDVFFLSNNGIYIEEKPYSRVKNVAWIDQAFGLTFDGDDRPMYSDKNSIYRLLRGKNSRLCGDVLSWAE